MKPYDLQVIDSENQWNELIVSFPHYHLLQTWQWGEIKKPHGWKPYRYVIKDNDSYIAAFQLMIKKVHAKVPISIAYVPRGPLFDFVAIDLDRLLITIETLARNRDADYVKVDPDFEENSEPGDKWLSALRQNDWRYSPQQVQMKNTGMTELIPDDPKGEEKLLMDMKKTWRYNIRSSVKRGVEITRGTQKDISKFYELYKDTSSRQHFSIRGEDYYRDVYSSYHNGKDSDSLLLLSRHEEEKEPLSSAMFIRFADKVYYLYAASSERRRADMPNYPMQWEGLKWARSTGAHNYDWGGAATDLDDPDDSMARVWHFKKGFGAEFHSGTGAWDKPINNFKWTLIHQLNRVRKLIRR